MIFEINLFLYSGYRLETPAVKTPYFWDNPTKTAFIKKKYYHYNFVNPFTHRAIKVVFIFLKRPEKTKIIGIEVEGSNRPIKFGINFGKMKIKFF